MTPPTPEKTKHSRKQGILLGLERFSRQRYGIVFIAALFILAGGAWLGSRLTIDSDILGLIPEGNRQVDGFKAAVSEFGSISSLIALVEAPREPMYVKRRKILFQIFSI